MADYQNITNELVRSLEASYENSEFHRMVIEWIEKAIQAMDDNKKILPLEFKIKYGWKTIGENIEVFLERGNFKDELFQVRFCNRTGNNFIFLDYNGYQTTRIKDEDVFCQEIIKFVQRVMNDHIIMLKICGI